MKLGERWLRDWIDLPAELDGEGIARALTLLGNEVDEVGRAAPAFDGVVVARIDSVEPHPDADRLRVCRVEAGLAEPLGIVCGAPNAREGLVTALATVGATLPGSAKRLKKSKLRGVPSEGMLCSGAELGLSDAGGGIIELPADAPVGASLVDWLGLDEAILEVELTPDRGDCLSVRGIARELSAKLGVALADPAPVPGGGAGPGDPDAGAASGRVEIGSERTREVSIDPGCACVRFAGRVVEGVDLGAPVPLWMSERLRRAGVRSINVAVDVTNWVMLERGNPMHAFDDDRLAGAIRVRTAEAGERLALLDGREVELDADTTVIADDSGAISLAGIMGGDSTAVSETTRNVYLECAAFLPARIVGVPRRYATRSESSHRFERGVDFASQPEALELATALLIRLAGGRAGPATDLIDEDRLPVRDPVTLRRARLERTLGAHVEGAEVERILRALGVEVADAGAGASDGEGWRVTPPSWRYDLAIEEDFAEEVARVHGYENLARRLPAHRPAFRSAPETAVGPLALKRLLAARGYQEVVTYSFVDADRQAALRPDLEALALANPISADLAVMRTTLAGGLIDVAARNRSRQSGSMRLFEAGLRFLPVESGGAADGAAGLDPWLDASLGDDIQLGDDLVQQGVLGGLVTGRRLPESWRWGEEPAGFFDLKADVEALFALANANPVEIEAGGPALLHPGRAATLRVDGRAVGWLGALSPALERATGLEGGALLFEIALGGLARSALPVARAPSRFPRVRRDLALEVDETIPHAALLATVRAAAPPTLAEIVTFDVYAGEGTGAGRRSLALGLVLQDDARTLEDRAVDGALERIVAALGAEHGAVPRGGQGGQGGQAGQGNSGGGGAEAAASPRDGEG